MKKSTLTLIVSGLLIVLIFTIVLSSCSTKGYGCKGKSKYITGYKN